MCIGVGQGIATIIEMTPVNLTDLTHVSRIHLTSSFPKSKRSIHLMSDTQTQQSPYETRTSWDLFVNGAPTTAQSGETFDVINPATNEKLTTVAKAGRADVDAAVQAARTAFEGGKWMRMGAARRASILIKVAAIMRDRFEHLARLEALNTGKAIAQCKAELTQAIENFEFFAGAATKIMGETIPVPGNFFNYTVREPIGVCAADHPLELPPHDGRLEARPRPGGR